VRTALNPRLFTAEKNGIGRNALIEAYLRPGDYLIEARSLGLSKGRAGLHLSRNPLQEVAALQEGYISRKTVAAASALRYRIDIDEPGRYRLNTFGLGTDFNYRLEDSGGWPIGPAVGNGSIDRRFDRGRFYYYSLPLALKTRRLTLLEAVKTKTEETEGRETKSPLELVLNKSLNRTWRESPERDPDVVVLTLPAPIRATLSLSKGMEAFLSLSGEEDFRYFMGGRDHSVDLAMGRYEVRIRSIEENDRFPYSVMIGTSDLIPGLTQSISRLPATIPVSFGQDGHVDIWSFGQSDVKAMLRDEEGRLLAEHDDMKDDWNFRISKQLEAGRYNLRIAKVGYVKGSITVSMEDREERSLNRSTRYALPFSDRLRMQRTVIDVPIVMGGESGLVEVSATATEPVLIAVFSKEEQLAEGENRIFIPLRSNTPYNLKFWHRGDASLLVETEARLILSHPEGRLSGGQTSEKRAPDDSIGDVSNAGVLNAGVLNAVVFAGEPLSFRLSPDRSQELPHGLPSVVYIFNPSGLSFTIETETEALSAGGSEDRSPPILYSSGFDEPCLTVGRYPKNTTAEDGWLVRIGGESPVRIRLAPLILEEQRTASVLVGGVTHSFLIENSRGRVLLIEADSPGMLTGTSLFRETNGRPQRINWDGLYASVSRTLVAAYDPGRYRGSVWAIGREGVVPADYRVSLRPRSFRLSSRPALRLGQRRQVELEGQRAVSFSLAERSGVVDLLLPKGLIAFVWNRGICEGLVVAEDRSLQASLVHTGGTLVLVNPEATSTLARAESRDNGRPLEIRIGAGESFEQVFGEAGELSFRVESGGEGRRLFVAGDAFEARLEGTDGNLYSGRSAPGRPYRIFPAKEGDLRVRYGEGFLKIWMAREGDVGFVGRLPTLKTDGLHTTTRIGDEPRLLSFEMQADGFVLVETKTRGISALYGDDRILGISAGGRLGGSRMFVYLKTGSYKIYYRPFPGGTPEGSLFLHRLYPSTLEGGTDEPLRIIGPKEVQTYRFTVKMSGKVGIGVGVDSDLLTSRVYNRDLEVLGRGTLVFEDLQEGEYFLVVEGGQRPVQYRPIVLGLEGSLQAIPDDVIRRYLEEEAE
jgi:hypothetical protein